jgi:GAF domain-containing protein
MGKAILFPAARGSNGRAFRPTYAAAFEAFLIDPTERALRAAYELGRDAVSQRVGLLELAQTHHAVVLSALTDATKTVDPERIMAAASDFFLEAMSAYEMVRRAVAEVEEAVQSERRQAEMIRQLSSLLADASLAASTNSSIAEMLQLVVEQAHELIDASWCIAHAHVALPRATGVYAVAGSEPAEPADVVEEGYAAFAARPEAVPVRIHVSAGADAVIAAPLSALNGSTIGLLATGTDGGRRFTELDDAVFIHIAQMTAAALERAMRYHVPLP